VIRAGRDEPDGAPVALSAPSRRTLEALLGLLATERDAPSAVRDPAEAWRVHVEDSLSGLAFGALAGARRIADIGSGAGFPGLVLAVALPGARVDAIESQARKCEFIRLATARCGIANARVVCERAEAWAGDPPPAGGREAYDAVTARAVGRLATLAELASPLLAEGGALVAWKGKRDRDEEAEIARAAPRLAMQPVECRAVGPFAGSRHRHIHLLRKSGPTPDGLPRRAGMAKKKPYGAARGG
jgi:16S rRNA (guanine527-N7)-methyltransferase